MAERIPSARPATRTTSRNSLRNPGRPLQRNPVGSAIRCAIYTRKSSEEGLEQDFNSLDAQREACEAYITSQRSEGWIALPRLYDDGGFSGGTMERPALKALLADIAAGLIDTVVVYKVDRLTRSLTDFARIVDVFDQAKVSFVSVTQSFNTTTSMGRLTLNMLLSFAQFEREVTGERIRDKIAASKAKGMWMGGRPPLGYTVEDRKLVIVPEEAEQVREIFRRYLALGSVYDLVQDLAARNIRAKRHVSVTGNQTGGGILERGALYHLLQNRLYRGEITHKHHVYPGQHDPIVDQTLWAQVQDRLSKNRVERDIRSSAAEPSLLTGLLIDEDAIGFSPTHAKKNGRRYRYYVSHDLIAYCTQIEPPQIRFARSENQQAAASPQGLSTRPDSASNANVSRRNSQPRRLPAADIEGIVVNGLLQFLKDPAKIDTLYSQQCVAAPTRMDGVRAVTAFATAWPGLQTGERILALRSLVENILIGAATVTIRLRPKAILAIGTCKRLATSDQQQLAVGMFILSHDTNTVSDIEPVRTMQPIEIIIPVALKRVGKEIRHIMTGQQPDVTRKPDQSLIRTLALAHRYKNAMEQSTGKTIAEIAADCGVTSSYFIRILRLAYLTPSITQTILSGEQPLEISSYKLTLKTEIAPSWKKQRLVLGFPSV